MLCAAYAASSFEESQMRYLRQIMWASMAWLPLAALVHTLGKRWWW
jgi:hypothetical protein